jgi:hypothetical protein
MKQILILALAVLCMKVNAFAQKQKITVDDDTIKVNGISYAVIEKKSGLAFDFRIKSLQGKDLINFQFQEFNNPNKANQSNPKGRVTYFEVSFMNDGQKCEVQSVGSKKGVAKMVVENNLIKNNEVDTEGENSFVMINGMKFSQEKRDLNGPKVIIIER